MYMHIYSLCGKLAWNAYKKHYITNITTTPFGGEAKITGSGGGEGLLGLQPSQTIAMHTRNTRNTCIACIADIARIAYYGQYTIRAIHIYTYCMLRIMDVAS